MIEKTEALVLRIAPFSRTSHVVTWLTPAHGKLVTVVKGACRPKSLFLGQYDLFYTCEMLYYSREATGIHICRECAALESREALRSDWRSACCASYVCDMVSRVAQPAHPQPELYPLAASTLDALCAGRLRLQTVLRFEIHLLTALGLAPQLTVCAACARPLGSERRPLFSHALGGLLCGECSRERPAPARDASRVAPDVVAILRNWQTRRTPRAARNTRCTPAQLTVLRDLLGSFLHYHVDLSLPSRKIALDVAGGRESPGESPSTRASSPPP